MLVRLTKVAQRDLDAIWWAVARDASIRTADGIVDKIASRIADLELFPELGAPRGDLFARARLIVAAPWLIVCRVTQDDILVVRVVDGRRDLSRLRWPAP